MKNLRKKIEEILKQEKYEENWEYYQEDLISELQALFKQEIEKVIGKKDKQSILKGHVRWLLIDGI